MDLSVIIVNYNVRQFLENALTSIRRAMAGIEGEVIVVDNASSDGSAEMVRERFPEVTVIESAENVGFSRANNRALSHVRGNYLLLINPDTIVQEDTFRVMLDFFAEHPEVGLAGCKILNPDGSFQLPCRRSFPTPWVAFTKTFGLSSLFPKSRLFGRYNLTYLDPDRTYEVDAVSGSFMMISRAAYDKVGGLDEAFFMYGEDLDWCYRVKQAGYRVYYVHATLIVHFKGESTKRSEINELRLFYEAMGLFVQKHFNQSRAVRLLLEVGIGLRGAAASVGRAARPLLHALVDMLGVDLALALSAAAWFGDPFLFPTRANPVVWVVPAVVVVLTGSSMGLYTVYSYATLRSAGSVLIGYVLVSALVFFAKEFAYSRAVVLLSGVLSILFLPGWRWLVRRWGVARVQHGARRSLFGRRTVIVGTGDAAIQVLRKLRARVDGGYEVLGFIAHRSTMIGERIAGLEVIGSMDNVGKVINERRVAEVIFATEGISYADILSVIARSGSRSVNFRLVPGSLEAIIGKTRIDELDTLPLVDIEYNIHKAGHRFVKRMVDVLVSAVALLILYLPVRFFGRRGNLGPTVRRLPDVFRGSISLVGLPAGHLAVMKRENRPSVPPLVPELGPEGLTGLIQINRRDDLTAEETERYALYYAKNQSLILDLEILLKTLLLRLRS